jgi:hypothetical protein
VSALPFLLSYLGHSPQWQELQSIWDTQLSVKDLKVTVELLALLTDILSLQPPPAGHTASAVAVEDTAAKTAVAAAAGDTAVAVAVAAAGVDGWLSLSSSVDDLATSIINRRLKALYFNLSSGSGGHRETGREGGRVLGTAEQLHQFRSTLLLCW